MGLTRPQDRELYREWLAAIEEVTDRDVAALMPDFTERGVAKLRATEPSRLQTRTRKLMRDALSALQKPVFAVRERPHMPYNATGTALGSEARVWVQRFLLRLTEAGCNDAEIEEARRLLTKSDLVAYAHGGTPGQGQLSEPEQLQLVKTIASAAIIPRLKAAGRKVSAAIAR